MNIGVLALQGAFAEHRHRLKKLGCASMEIRRPGDLAAKIDGLIIPGGESTVMGKLLEEFNLIDPLRKRILDGLPVFGTCAGLILLAGSIDGCEKNHIGTMEITAVRNAYGRQLGSFRTQGDFRDRSIPMTFIRAPFISYAGPDVAVLSIIDNRIVAAEQKNMLVTAFHPELNDDTTVHEYFLKRIVADSQNDRSNYRSV